MDLIKVKAVIKHVSGYDVPIDDDGLLEYMVDAKTKYICSECATDEVPADAEPILCELVAGEYLRLANKSNILSEDALNVVKQIKEGDVSITLEGDSDLQRLNSAIAHLLRGRDFSCWRKMRW